MNKSLDVHIWWLRPELMIHGVREKSLMEGLTIHNWFMGGWSVNLEEPTWFEAAGVKHWPRDEFWKGVNSFSYWSWVTITKPNFLSLTII